MSETPSTSENTVKTEMKPPLTTSIAKPSGIKPPSASALPSISRISRPCSGHATPKAGPPPQEPKSK